MKIINFREGKPWNITILINEFNIRVFIYFAFRYLSFVFKIVNLKEKYNKIDYDKGYDGFHKPLISPFDL